ncbi:MAG: universal stress protein [Planctomycetales bacterium]|nr:universal stress protein [Planctomycetales bacterium]
MKILLATDGSRFANGAAAFLAHLPHAGKIDLVVLAVTEPVHLHGSDVVMDWIKKNQEAERGRAEEACQSAAAMFEGANVSVECRIVVGHAGRQIVATAKELGADLIVVGAEGHSVVARMLLGSVSDFVATHADCSVLVVRPNKSAGEPSKELHLCIAHDASDSAKRTITQLGAFDWQHHSSIDVVSVISLPFTYMDPPMEFDLEPIRTATEQAVQFSTESLRALTDDVTYHLVEANHVGDAIVRFAKQHNCDVVALGSTGLGLINHLLLGSVANYVLRHADCSIWITRERGQ